MLTVVLIVVLVKFLVAAFASTLWHGASAKLDLCSSNEEEERAHLETRRP